MKKVLLFGGTDGHGVAMTVISERNLRSEGFEVTTICKYVVTKYGEPLPDDCGTGQAVLF
jgi:methylmalonyl-CoA mutase cobalamin-binding subunit